MEKTNFPIQKKNVVLKFAVSEENTKPFLISLSVGLLLFAIISK
jgi:hypothetical protein